jgi:hypothetical protein
MTKKKTGRLSGSMITRHRRGEGVGFVVREASDKPETPERAEAPDNRREAIAQRESVASAGWEAEHAAVIPSGGPDEDKDTQRVAEVVPLYPKLAGDDAAPAEPDRSLGRGVHARADNLVDALRSADIAEAEEIFADMTGLGQVEVLRLLYGPEGRDLALVCRAMGLEQLQFVSVYILARKLGLGEEALDARELARVVAYFDALDESEVEAALASWRGERRDDAGKPHGPA